MITQPQLAAAVAEGLSIRALAARFACSGSTVRHWLKRHGFKTRHCAAPARRRTFTPAELEAAVHTSTSMAGVTRALDMAISGANYISLRRAIETAGLVTDHWRQGVYQPPLDLTEVLVADSTRSLSSFRTRIFAGGLLPERCALCGLGPQWQDRPLTLQIDHINGDRYDHRLENLRTLCPNCHTQTPTFGGKSTSKTPRRNAAGTPICRTCGACIDSKGVWCRACVPRRTKIAWPSDAALVQMLVTSNFSAVARDLGVSDNAVRKRLRRRKMEGPGGLEPPAFGLKSIALPTQ